jgi:ATP-dependent DNA helicase RecQ
LNKRSQLKRLPKNVKLTVQTIEGHLSHYVQNGIIKLDEVVSREKIILIEPEAKNFAGGPIAALKEKLGNKATWGEIRLVLASIEYQTSSTHVNH